MSKKLTAIELAAKKIKDEIPIYGGEGWDVMEEVLIILNETLQLEKDQIEDAYREGRSNQQSSNGSFYNRNAELYYKENYGQPIITITTKPDNHD